jgi:DNA-binding NarL/FixJ family response regulator
MSVKTILIAHQSLTVRDRFAAALADAQQNYVLAGGVAGARAALASDRTPVNLVLVDLALATDDPLALVTELRSLGPRPVAIVVFAGSVPSAGLIGALASAGVAGYVNEHADAPQILPALAPYLFPDNFNRRSSARRVVAAPVSLRVNQTITTARTRDVGRGGIGIQTLDPLPPETPVQVSLRVPGGTGEISAPARVIWGDRRIGMGMQFERLNTETQAAIDDYVLSKRIRD